MASQTAYNYLLSTTNNTIGQIASAQQSAADLTTVGRALERTILTNVFSEVRELCADEPSLANMAFSISQTPILQILDTRGQEEYRIFLPTRGAVRDSYFTWLTGSGYSPTSVAEANAYYANVNALLASSPVNESRDFSLLETFAEDAEKQIPALLTQLRITPPPVREWINMLAWEAGDGDDRSRELLGYTLTSFIMGEEIDDYSAPGQQLTSDRVTLRLGPPSLTTDTSASDAANSLLDEINGNLDTQGLTGDCFSGLTPEGITANQAALDASLRYIPALHSSGGVTSALAQVQETVTDPDMLAEATAELINKGTPNDPVYAAIQAAAKSNTDRYGLPDMTDALLAIENQANVFLSLSESLFGSKDSSSFRTMVALGPDGRLSGFRRREALVTLRQSLVPTVSVEINNEVEAFLWMLANREIDFNGYTSAVWQTYVQAIPADYWGLQAYVDSVFLTPEILASAKSLALTAIQADLLELTTGLTPADKDTFNDALSKLADIAFTPEDRQVQFDRLRDIGQRFSNFADTVTFRYYLEVLVGGGYLADLEYYQLYTTLISDAARALPDRDPNLLKAEFQAYGNLNFSDTYAGNLILALQESTNSYFSEAELANFTGDPGSTFQLAGGALAYDRYWTTLAGKNAKIVFDICIQLSRTLNTLFDQDRAMAVTKARLAMVRHSPYIPDPITTSALMEALMGQVKTPQAKREESAYLTLIFAGNTDLPAAYNALIGAVQTVLDGVTHNLPGASQSDLQGATAVVYYPLILFTKNNEYVNGITITSVNIAPQGGRVLSSIGNTYTSKLAAPTDPVDPVPAHNTIYFPQGSGDVVSQAQYDPTDYTFSGENPANTFLSGIFSNPNFISDYIPDLRVPNAASNLSFNLQNAVSSVTGNLQNILCKMDMLNNLITQLNGVTDAVTGAIIGGINNAISSINNTIKGLTDSLSNLLNTVGNMGSVNLSVNCKCMSFDLSVNLKKLLQPISSWLTSFGAALQIPNPFAGLKNPFHLNPNLGCPSSMLAALGGLGGSK
jgi:hypothetical protein